MICPDIAVICTALYDIGTVDSSTVAKYLTHVPVKIRPVKNVINNDNFINLKIADEGWGTAIELGEAFIFKFSGFKSHTKLSTYHMGCQSYPVIIV